MDDHDLQALQTWSTSDLNTMPKTSEFTAAIDPCLLSFDTHHGWALAEGRTHNESNASSSSSPPQKPLIRRKRKEPWQYRRAPPSAIEKKYRAKLRSALDELSNAIPVTRAASPALADDGGLAVVSTEPAKNRKKRTVMLEAVEYIKQLEDENRSLMVLLSDRLLGSGQDGGYNKCEAAPRDLLIDDELWSDLSSLCHLQ